MLNGSNTEGKSDIAYITLEVLLALLAIGGNILVCWAVAVTRSLRNPTNYFLLSLAAADIAVGFLAIPFAIIISIGFYHPFYGCLFLACFVLILTQSSIFSLLAVAVDRYIAIKLPLRYGALMTGQRARVVIASCWLASFIIGLIPLLGWNRKEWFEKECQKNNTAYCLESNVRCLFEYVISSEYLVYFNFFGCILLPLFIMLVIYTNIFLAARSQLRHIGPTAGPNGECPRSILIRELQAAKSLAIIVGLFAFCWLPLHILNCIHLFSNDFFRPPWTMFVAILLSHANSAINPVIYAYRLSGFRTAFRRIFHRCLHPNPAHPLWALNLQCKTTEAKSEPRCNTMTTVVGSWQASSAEAGARPADSVESVEMACVNGRFTAADFCSQLPMGELT
uniref:adenosine receptor A2b-like isoform X2 n=1 Tax=Myxine glutinosa TaxID=7769 RepID=UPI00358F501B